MKSRILEVLGCTPLLLVAAAAMHGGQKDAPDRPDSPRVVSHGETWLQI